MKTGSLNRKHQEGLTALGILVVLLVGAFILTAAFKIGPLYLDNSFVKQAIDSLAEENYREMSDRQIYRHLQSNFDINNIRDMSAKDIKIERKKHKLLVTLDYEKRVNFMANVDVVVKFENHFDSSEQ